MKNLITTIALTALLTTAVSAASVNAHLSTREAFVGSPVTLQLEISDATDYEQPALPKIDGCDVRSAGSPAQSSQITIINGRRSESRSVTMQYLITPRREGTFNIPAMSFKVDGKTVTTDAMRFVATKSDTGDLLFVEIEGKKEKVFVGEPLDLTLKIWIKPFRDPKTGQTLSEGDMWNMISTSTSWGSFTTRMKEMAENRQRPGGQEVLRSVAASTTTQAVRPTTGFGAESEDLRPDEKKGNASERAYYLYEINATVYPKRAGKIDASDVQIVVDYPTALGKSRSPFGSMFGDDRFGGNSMMSRMMNDDFFASSFGNQITVTAARPIVGEVSVDATEVQPVPTQGRPASYRGAVGRYHIVTQATPTTVDAGDPITLNIAIAGTGPMDLVQAPPLYEQTDLTKDFKVADESLAGFVKEDTKVFSTTIRPRREGITEIPGIQFSFFDPETETFQTVTSDPIAVTVHESETLALDAIVGGTRNASSVSAGPITHTNLPDFTNYTGPSVLLSQTPRGESNRWWVFVILPPLVWIGTLIGKYRESIADRLRSFRSPKARCLAAIERASSGEEIALAVAVFILRQSRTGQNPDGSRSQLHSLETSAIATQAVGALRIAGMYPLASETESFLASCHGDDVQTLASTAATLVQTIDATVKSSRKNKVKTRRSKPIRMKLAGPLKFMLAAIVVASATCTPAVAEVARPAGDHVITLSETSALTLLSEATEAYDLGIAKSQTDPAEAKDLLATSAQKYELLVDNGICNAELFTNLGNAHLQTGKLGNAIANYEKALQVDPSNAQASKNLAFAETQVSGSRSRQDLVADATGIQGRASWTTAVRTFNDRIVDVVGARSVYWVLALSSIAFWGLLIMRTVHRPFPVWKSAAVPLAALLISLTSVGLTQTNIQSRWNAVIVTDTVSLHAGDGAQFASVVTVDSAQGHRVETLAARGKWTQVRTVEGHVGWVPSRDVVNTSLDHHDSSSERT